MSKLDSLREALQLVNAYPGIRKHIGTEIHDKILDALAAKPQPALLSDNLREALQLARKQVAAIDSKHEKVSSVMVNLDLLRHLLANEPPADKGAMRILESLTPTGSEFVGDPEACAAYVRKKISTLHDVEIGRAHV